MSKSNQIVILDNAQGKIASSAYYASATPIARGFIWAAGVIVVYREYAVALFVCNPAKGTPSILALQGFDIPIRGNAETAETLYGLMIPKPAFIFFVKSFCAQSGLFFVSISVFSSALESTCDAYGVFPRDSIFFSRWIFCYWVNLVAAFALLALGIYSSSITAIDANGRIPAFLLAAQRTSIVSSRKLRGFCHAVIVTQNAGISATITTAQLTPTGAQGSMTFTNGILTAQTPAT